MHARMPVQFAFVGFQHELITLHTQMLSSLSFHCDVFCVCLQVQLENFIFKIEFAELKVQSLTSVWSLQSMWEGTH